MTERQGPNRREFLAGSVAAVAGMLTRHVWAEPGATEIAKTRAGKVQGVRTGDTVAFLGIPFAAPPVGALRFRAPQPAPPWEGVRPALAYAPAPVQLKRLRTSEDCLYLNVWRPAAPGPHPVLFWIYGGGNTTGATGGIADGEHFARSGVVCVTPAYRVGALGFLDVSEVLGHEYAGSGNNGLRDQMLALRWVHENIAEFGGDPHRITIGGESAGAKDTCALLSLRETRGLYQQAIVESGSGQTVHTLDSAAELTQTYLECAGLTPRTVDALRTMTPAALMAAQRKLEAETSEFPFRTTVDGVVMEETPLAAIQAGATRGLRLLAGSNHDESTLFVRGAELDAPLRQSELQNMTLADAEAMVPRYKQLYPEMPWPKLKIRLLTAEEYWIPTLRVAEAHVSHGGRAYFYRFDHARTSGPLKGEVPHASELAFVWDSVRWAPDDPGLRASMHGAWVEFLRGDAPALTSTEGWPEFELKRRPVMVVNDQSRVMLDPDGKERRLWEEWGLAVQATAPVARSARLAPDGRLR